MRRQVKMASMGERNKACHSVLAHAPLLLNIPWWQGSWGQHGAHLGPTGPRWAPCWPHGPCYLANLTNLNAHILRITPAAPWLPLVIVVPFFGMSRWPWRYGSRSKLLNLTHILLVVNICNKYGKDPFSGRTVAICKIVPFLAKSWADCEVVSR